MDMHKKREMRKKKREENVEVSDNVQKTNINCPILPNVKSALSPYK